MKSSLFRMLFCLFLTAVFFQVNSVFAADLHAIIVCDTHAVNLEDGVELDYKHIKRELRKVAKLTHLNLSMHTFKGKKVTSRFIKEVEKLQAKPDDVIVFYWSGHGTRFYDQKKSDPWPYFDFEYDRDLQSLLDVTKELMKKNARLVLSIADCCNDFEGRDQFVESKDLVKRGLKPSERLGYEKLFLHERGVYIASAALPGESSIALDEKDKDMRVPGGSFFTNAILEVIHKEVLNPGKDLCWDKIFDLAALKTIEYQLRDLDDPVIEHHPQYERLSK